MRALRKQLQQKVEEATEGLHSKKAHQAKSKFKEQLHKMMDEQLATREERLNRAQTKQDTTTMWKLISASLEAAFIEFLDLSQQDAKQNESQSHSDNRNGQAKDAGR